MKMNRRGFLAALLSAPVIPLAAKLPEFERKQIIFLPPRCGWVSTRPQKLYLENESFAVQHDVKYLYGYAQFPLAVARGRARITLAGNLPVEQARTLDLLTPVRVAGWEGLWLPHRIYRDSDSGDSSAYATLEQVWQPEMHRG